MSERPTITAEDVGLSKAEAAENAFRSSTLDIHVRGIPSEQGRRRQPMAVLGKGHLMTFLVLWSIRTPTGQSRPGWCLAIEDRICCQLLIAHLLKHTVVTMPPL